MTTAIRPLPGAVGTFALLGEVLWIGLLVSVASVPLITAPAAIAAGARHIERYLQARDTGVRFFLTDLRAALLPGGIVVGVAAVVAAGALVLQLLTLPGSSVPGAEVLPIAVAVLLLAGLVLLVIACAAWSPARTWRQALQASVHRIAADPLGGVLAAVAVSLTALAAWQLPPLVVPAIGCLVFAIVVVRVRRRGTRDRAGRTPEAGAPSD